MASAAAKEGACPSRSYPGPEPNGYREKKNEEGWKMSEQQEHDSVIGWVTFTASF